jgi:hypothetical protein
MNPEEYNKPNDANNEARGYKVEDDDNLEEKDLKRHYLFGEAHMADPDTPGHESESYGGQNFGKSNVTTSGDDSANPSRHAGYTNDYFKRTEPSEEHPENNNFKPAFQEGEPTQTGEGHSGNTNVYQEGTADYDGGTQRDQPANANPDQNKIGDGGSQNKPGEANWNSDYDRGPDYGSNSPDEQEHIET